jgi:hypothetical protein
VIKLSGKPAFGKYLGTLLKMASSMRAKISSVVYSIQQITKSPPQQITKSPPQQITIKKQPRRPQKRSQGSALIV